MNLTEFLLEALKVVVVMIKLPIRKKILT